jgi:hypothetical protein
MSGCLQVRLLHALAPAGGCWLSQLLVHGLMAVTLVSCYFSQILSFFTLSLTDGDASQGAKT